MSTTAATLKTPHLNTDEHRKVGWLELFYDLVYVATVVQLSNKLSDDVSANGFISFVLLFIPVWWVWMGATFYNNRFVADDLPHRAMVFGQIFALCALAVYVYDGLGETSAGFAVAYAIARFVLVLQYLRTARFVPEARELSRRYATGFAIAAVIWLISAFVPPPVRFILWIVGLAIDFGTPLTQRSLQLQRAFPPSPHHLPERLGLFTIIVLGESFIKVIGGYAGEEITTQLALIGVLGFVLVGGMWWLYNDTIAERHVVWSRSGVQAYIYGHLPLHLGLIALAVGIYKSVTSHSDGGLSDKYRLLICGAAAICFVSLAIIELWTDARLRVLDSVLRVIGAAIALGVGFFGTGLGEFVVVLILVVVLVVQEAIDLLSVRQVAEDPPAIEL